MLWQPEPGSAHHVPLILWHMQHTLETGSPSPKGEKLQDLWNAAWGTATKQMLFTVTNLDFPGFSMQSPVSQEGLSPGITVMVFPGKVSKGRQRTRPRGTLGLGGQ